MKAEELLSANLEICQEKMWLVGRTHPAVYQSHLGWAPPAQSEESGGLKEVLTCSLHITRLC